MNAKSWLALLLFVPLLSSCQDDVEAPPTPAPIRSVKLFTVTDNNTASERRFSGTTVATSSASLSFPVSGKITEILVKEGQEVKKGQLLAKLDAESFLRQKNMMEAQSQQAKVVYADKKGDYTRKKPLGDKGVITQRELEESKAAMLSAKEQVNFANTQLKQAEDSVKDTFLYSPYDGIISERSSEPFVEVSASQQILLLENKGALEVEISVPENIINKISLGQSARIAVKSNENELAGSITEIGVAADVGNVFKVKVKVDDTGAVLYSGLSAEVRLSLAEKNTSIAQLIPLSCIVAGDDGLSYVYVYNPDSKTVKMTPVTYAKKMAGNTVAVNGISIGDQIVSAGGVFLSDGMEVKPFQASL